jgi:hypothetical protein
MVASEFWDALPENARKAMYDSRGQQLLVGHVGTPDEIAEAYIFAMKARRSGYEVFWYFADSFG